MWSSVVMSSGLVILIGCAVAGTILLKKQYLNGTTGYKILATSDSFISVIIGATLVGFALAQESNMKSSACSEPTILVSAATFLPSFVNSFISMLLMAVECWADSKVLMQSENEQISIQKRKGKKRVTTAMLTQWALPILAVLVLHFMTPRDTTTFLFRNVPSNESCILGEMFLMNMEEECEMNTNIVESDMHADNVTVAVVQRIYELIHNSVHDDIMHEPVPDHSPAIPQTKEEWRDLLHLPVEASERNQRRIREKGLTDDFLTCDESCMMSIKTLHVYFLSVILSIYIVPMIGTATLHHTVKMKRKFERKKTLGNPEDLSITTTEQNKECHLTQIKMMALSNFVLWTPSLVEKLLRRWLCSSPPKWLAAVLFIMGHMTSVIRGLINANPPAYERAFRTNVVVPSNSESHFSTQNNPAESYDNNGDSLFHKRKQEPEP